MILFVEEEEEEEEESVAWAQTIYKRAVQEGERGAMERKVRAKAYHCVILSRERGEGRRSGAAGALMRFSSLTTVALPWKRHI